MTSGKSGSKKKEQIREKRLRRQRQQRLVLVIGFIAVAFIIVAVAVAPTIRESMTPVAAITPITPAAHPFANAETMGNPNAKVKIELWEDFQCPACQQFTETVEPQVISNYINTGKVYYVFHNYPFIDDKVGGNESKQAANAAMCAADQNRFWDYHDLLFKNWSGEGQGAFVNKRLVAFAQTLSLNMTAFNQCFNANTHKSAIDLDRLNGDKVGVNGTPSVFVNGQIVSPGLIPSYQDVSKAVDVALAGQ